MTDYSVKMRCQAYTKDHVHCSRRGRLRYTWDVWLCWQHYHQFLYWPDDEPMPWLTAVAPLEV